MKKLMQKIKDNSLMILIIASLLTFAYYMIYTGTQGMPKPDLEKTGKGKVSASVPVDEPPQIDSLSLFVNQINMHHLAVQTLAEYYFLNAEFALTSLSLSKKEKAEAIITNLDNTKARLLSVKSKISRLKMAIGRQKAKKSEAGEIQLANKSMEILDLIRDEADTLISYNDKMKGFIRAH